MAAMEPGRNGGGNEPSSRKGITKGVAGVNFEEMNYEQRRAPYNSGQRLISDQQFDSSRGKSDADGKPDME